MKRIKDHIQIALAVIIVVCFFLLVWMLLFFSIPKENVETMNLATGALLTAFGTVVGYYFGSSAGSQRKTDMLSKAEPLKDSE